MVRLKTGKVPVTTRPRPCRDCCFVKTIKNSFNSSSRGSSLQSLTKASWYTLVHWTCLASVPARTMGRPSTSRYSWANTETQHVTVRSFKTAITIRKQREWACQKRSCDAFPERGWVQQGELKRVRRESAVSEEPDKPTWVLILIAQMERISK